MIYAYNTNICKLHMAKALATKADKLYYIKNS